MRGGVDGEAPSSCPVHRVARLCLSVWAGTHRGLLFILSFCISSCIQAVYGADVVILLLNGGLACAWLILIFVPKLCMRSPSPQPRQDEAASEVL